MAFGDLSYGAPESRTKDTKAVLAIADRARPSRQIGIIMVVTLGIVLIVGTHLVRSKPTTTIGMKPLRPAETMLIACQPFAQTARIAAITSR